MIARATRARWSRPVTAVALLALTAAGGVLGFAATRAAAEPRPSSALAALSTLTTTDPHVFERPQRPADLVEAAVGTQFLRSTLRRLAITPDVPTAVSAARTASGQTCLVAAVRGGTQFVSSCVSPAVFARRGVTLQWSLSGWSAGARFVEEGYLARFITLSWGPDDRLRYRMRVQGEE